MRKKQRILVKVDFDQQRTEEEFPVPLHKDEPKFEDEDVIVLHDDDIVLDVKDDIVLLPLPPSPKTEQSNKEIKCSAPKLEYQVPVPKKKGGPPRKYSTNEERLEAISERRQQLRADGKARGKEIKEDGSQSPCEKKTEMKGEDAIPYDPIQVQKKKGGAPRKYSSIEEKRKARCERERRRRAEMDPETKAEILRDRKAKAKRRMMLSENEEMLRAQRNSEYMARQARLAKMTDEDKAELRRKQQEWRRNLTEEQKKRRRNYDYFKYQAKLAKMTNDERNEWKKKNTEYARNWRASLTGEKRQRYLEYVRRKSKESMERHNRKPGYHPSSENYERFKEYQRMRTATETPEERQKRLRRYKVNQAVRKLKKELENEGVPQEEIEEKAKELKERMWAEPLPPPEKISSYTTRQRKGGGGGGESAFPQFVNKIQPRRKLNQFQSGPSVNENSDSYRGSETVDSETNSEITEIESQDDDNQVEGYHECDHDDGDYEDAIGDPPPVEVEIEACTAATPGPNITELPTTPSMNLKSSSSPSHECPHCIFSFPEKSDLTAHIISEHPKKCWKCPLCKIILLSPAELKEHFQCQHAQKVHVKTTTHTTVTKSVDLPNKVEVETVSLSKSANSGTFTCMKCDPLSLEPENRFGTQKDLNEHVKSKHPDSHWPCRKCGLLKYSERTLRTHEIVCGAGASRTIRM